MSYWDRSVWVVIDYARGTLREVLTVYLFVYYIAPEFLIDRQLLTIFLGGYFFDYAIAWAYTARDRKDVKLGWRVTLSRFVILVVTSWYYGFWYTMYVAVFTRILYGRLHYIGFVNLFDGICVIITGLMCLWMFILIYLALKGWAGF